MLGLEMSQWTVLIVGSLVATSCAILGVFLVLRKVAMLGDAISHAVLPGIAIAFLLTGDRAPIILIFGAALVGVLTVFLVGILTRSQRMREDASIGVVFPALFSVGVILISRYAGQVDLDLDCVIFGEILLSHFDRLVVGGTDIGPRAFYICGPILVLNIGMVALLYKELKLSSFDPALAASLGFSPVLLHYVLMSAVSVTVVGSFESVGAILVVAMLVVPPAAAYLFTHRLLGMLLLSIAFGNLASVLGFVIGWKLNCSMAGSMAASAGAIFVVSFLAAPRQGLIARLAVRRRLQSRFQGQLILLHLQDEVAVALETLRRRFGWSPRRLDRVVRQLCRQGQVERRDDGLRLTPRGAATLAAAGTQSLSHPVGDPSSGPSSGGANSG